jgi:hypothetical protein
VFCNKDTINFEKLLKSTVIHSFSDFTIAQIRSIKSLSIFELLTSMSFTMLLVGFCKVGSYRSVRSDLFTWLNHQQTNSVRNMNNTIIGFHWKCLYITHKGAKLFLTMPNSCNIIGVDTLTHLRSRCVLSPREYNHHPDSFVGLEGLIPAPSLYLKRWLENTEIC